MKDEDRKVAWGAVIVLAILAACFAWFLFVGPADHGPYYASHCEKDCEIPWFRSAVAWTCIFTGVLTFSSFFMWWETRRLASGADCQAGDIQKQLAVARDDFTSTHRPWISAKVEIAQPGIIIDQEGIKVTVRFELTNHGSSPAIAASVNAKLHFWHPLRPEVQNLRKICDIMHAPADAENAVGIAIMPNTSEKIDLGYIFPRHLFDNAVSAGQPILLWLAGCVDYAFSFGEPDPHQTGFVYYIGKAVPGNPRIQPIGPMDSLITQITIVKCSINGTFFAT